MIVFGAEDIGPFKYLKTLSELIENVYWITSKNTEPLIKKEKIISVDEIGSASIVVTGTSLGDSVDKMLLKKAQYHQIPSVSIIEHWSWYKKRFELDGNLIFPEHIIVNDEYAKTQAINDDIPIKILFVGGNPYLEKLSKTKLVDINLEYWKKKNNFLNKKIILFITEAIKNSFLLGTDDYLGYDEFEVLDDIIHLLPENSVLLIKTHPEEERDKYKHLESSHVKVFNSLGIEEMTQMPDLIIGMASMLLIELAMFRDDIISYRPNASKSFIGEKIAATHHAGTKAHLKEYIYNSPSSLAMPFRKKFKGSGERISKFLYNLT